MQRSTKKILAAFVLAFLCLNVGGLVCLTYCSQIAMASAMPSSDGSYLSEHCRRAKKEAEEKDQNAEKISATAASCCMMPVSMFAVPLEKQTRASFVLAADTAPAANVEIYSFSSPSIVSLPIDPAPVYRPPPLDRRGERILHSVIRI